MTYTAAFSASTPTRRRERLSRARLVILMIREMALSNDEMAEVIADLSHSLNMRENPIIAESETEAESEESDSDDEEYDENASDDENESDDEEYDENASDDENESDDEEYDENASDDEEETSSGNHDEDESNEIHNVHPSTLVLVGGVATFLKDIEDEDIDRMTNEEVRVYSQFVRRCEDDTDIESGNEIWEDIS